MILRKSIFPKSLRDFFVTSFVVVIIPVVYWFELFLVIPIFYDLWSSWYLFHFICGTFILLNIITNFVGVIICDTSINNTILPAKLLKNWRFCSTCECVAPPRSWHCDICNTCILKRDHHCMFTSCCIGHYNFRYFFMFILYLFIATVYASYYNLFFIYNDLYTWKSLFKLIFPLAMLFVEYSWDQLFLFLVLIVTVSCVLTGILLFYYLDLMCKNMITYERKYKNNVYDLGLWDNIRVCLGERWYVTWMSPYVKSKLRHDGINWVANETVKDK